MHCAPYSSDDFLPNLVIIHLSTLPLIDLTDGNAFRFFLDIIDAQSALLTARTNRSNAQFSVEQSRIALLHAIGGS